MSTVMRPSALVERDYKNQKRILLYTLETGFGPDQKTKATKQEIEAIRTRIKDVLAEWEASLNHEIDKNENDDDDDDDGYTAINRRLASVTTVILTKQSKSDIILSLTQLMNAVAGMR